MENSMEVPQKTKKSYHVIWQSHIPRGKTMVLKDTCTPLFTALLFTVTKTRKQPKYPLTDEWVKKMWYVYVYTHTHTAPHRYHSAKKKDEIVPFAKMWMDLFIIPSQLKTDIIWHCLYMDFYAFQMSKVIHKSTILLLKYFFY